MAMTLGVSTYHSSSANPSPAAPHDANGSRLSRNTSGSRDVDEAAGRRAERKADAEQAEAKANQISKRVLNIQGAEEKAAASFSKIDIYA